MESAKSIKQLVVFPLGETEATENVASASIKIEVENPRQAVGEGLAARPGEIIATSTTSFKEAIDSIKPAVQIIMNSLREFNQPSEIDLEFGIKLTAEAGAFVASAKTEANFVIKLHWDNK